MKFAELYQKSKVAVREALSAMWCSNISNESQKSYAEQIKLLLDEVFAPQYAMPLVQCMNSYEPLKTASLKQANDFVDGMWNKKYHPYEHQYQCWKTLSEKTNDDKVKSIVVTTGTGSGKTECFMLPLIADLRRNKSNINSIKAIFIYPLNALMEDQKERLQEYLSGSNLSFAVYNGNLPEDETEENQQQISYEKAKYANIIATRKDMRSKKPDILLTNPTMLEYMLLRDKDRKLFIANSLRWIVIDETHTYTGSAAAELAMLMRRVMLAFQVNSDTVRFATSSATIGNGENDADLKLKKFICGISGQSENQIEIIKGQRIDNDKSLNNPDADKCKQLLFKEEYLPLDKAIPGQKLTIEQRLARLDGYCEMGLKAKVHYFDKVLTQGFKVNLSNRTDGCFKIFTEVPYTENPDNPYLELMRCSKCGEYLAVAESQNDDEDTFCASTISDNDMFDFDSVNRHHKILLFGLTKNIQQDQETGNSFVEVKDNILTYVEPVSDKWNIVLNPKCKCPHCGSRIGKNEDENSESNEQIDYKTITSFRVSSDFVSRIIAPVVIDNLQEAQENKDKKPHRGQQFISFVDSRQAAAKATLQQNLEQERLWVYSRIFNELNRRKINSESQILILKKKYDTLITMPGFESDAEDYKKKIEKEKSSYLSWADIFNLLRNSPECDYLCEQFANKSKNSDEVDENGKPTEETKVKYIYSVMIELLGRRPASAKSPETMGLFCSYYPRLDEKVLTLPNEVVEFNNRVENDKNKITLQDWKDLLKIFLDYNVRSNMSVFLRDPNFSKFDIKKEYQRFQTQKIPTRPTSFPSLRIEADYNGNHKERVGELKVNPGNVVVLLASLLGNDYKSVVNQYENEISKVLEAIKTALLVTTIHNTDGNGLLEKEESTHSETNYRLNLMNLGFKLYDNVSICNTAKYSKCKPVLRPVDTVFKGYSPYLVDVKAQLPVSFETWSPFPFIDGKNCDNMNVSVNEIMEWGKTNRKALFDNNLWGDNGCFSDRYSTILSYPEIFIQAEHTAQIDKLVAKQSQDMFKAGYINILACSTTMEMGIDLGNLELVMMNSIPPHPANYKQRAGRSGRDIMNNNRSACITMCGTDSIGLRTLRDPLNTIINRKTDIPIVDLMSKQVIQRHINAYLLRESNVFSQGANINNLDQRIIDFFTILRFQEAIGAKYGTNVVDSNDFPHYPNEGLYKQEETKYNIFVDWLNNYLPTNELNYLIHDTLFESKAQYVVSNTISEIKRCNEELDEKCKAIGNVYEKYIIDLRIKKPNFEVADINNYINTSSESLAKYGRSIKFRFNELLAQGLLPYLATHRFTPNANMPVNVIEFDVNFKNSSSVSAMVSNPSYPLQESLSQYAPGNTIVLSNRAKTVRGLLTTGMFKEVSTFKTVYTNGKDVVIGSENKDKLSNLIEWPTNNRTDLELIQPYAFIPDINETDTRSVDRTPYTRVDAQLIGAGSWPDENSAHLISTRISCETGDSKILYYNDGIGYGYSFCPECGKTELEDRPHNIGINNHNNIQKLGPNNKPKKCNGKIRSNVIIGNTIQTDYCEIRIRKKANLFWIDNKKESLPLTLAIIFTKILAEYLGIEQRDITFTIMPNGNICIFDTNPGGSGYSKRLSDLEVLNIIIDRAYELCCSIKTKEDILDRYTMRYRDDINVKETTQWLSDEIACRNVLPGVVANVFPSATETNLTKLINFCENAANVKLFVSTNDAFNDWNYNDGDFNWRNRAYHLINKHKVDFHILSDVSEIPTPIKLMLSPASDWMSNIHIGKNTLNGLYPLALVDNVLYFTTEKNFSVLNELWGSLPLYCVGESVPGFASTNLSLGINSIGNVVKFKFTDRDVKRTTSKRIPMLVANKCQDLIEKFEAFVESTSRDSVLKISYQDEHLKSCAGIVVTLHFIEYFIKRFNKKYELSFKLEEYEVTSDDSNLRIESNMSQLMRDSKLTDWANDLRESMEQEGTIKDIFPLRKTTLPHWRVLSFECEGKCLNFYPDGGIVNEWLPDRNLPIVPLSDISIDSILNLWRRNDIMYDVELKGFN